MARLARPSVAQQVDAERTTSTASTQSRRRVILDSDDEQESEYHTPNSSDTDQDSSDSDSDDDNNAIVEVLGTRPSDSARSSLTQAQSDPQKEIKSVPDRKPLAADDITSMLTSLSISRASQDTKNTTAANPSATSPSKPFFDRINEKKLQRQQTLQQAPVQREVKPKHIFFTDEPKEEIKPRHIFFNDEPKENKPQHTDTSNDPKVAPKPKHTFFRDEPKFGKTTPIMNDNNTRKAAGLVRPRNETKPIPTMQFASQSSGMNAFKASAMKMAQQDLFAPIDPKSAQWGMRIDMDKLKQQAANTPRPPNDISFITKSQWGTKSGVGVLANLEKDPSIGRGNDFDYVSSEKTMESLNELFDTFDNKDAKEEEKLPFADGKVDGLTVTLLPHQIRGLRFLLERESDKLSNKGGLLCDDMGLGKTIQSISLILSNPMKPSTEKDAPIKTTLVVAPLALVHQWGNEIREKAPGLRVMVHHGPKRDKDNKDFKTYDVIVTTFQVVASEHAVNGPLFQQVWWRVIVDEAHTIKNHKAKSTIAAYALRSNRRWCLTGTPIQNSVDELQSLIGFLEIGPFDNRAKWMEQISKPISSGKGNLALKRLHVVLGAIMLRRTKVVLGESSQFKMPARKIHRRNITLSDPERSFYSNLEKRVSVALQDMQRNYLGALLLLLRLRQACNHISLANGEIVTDMQDQDSFEPESSPSGGDDLADIMSGLSITDTKTKDSVKSALEDTKSSSKINELMGLLAKDPDRKTIVFSQFTSMLNLIEPVFKAKGIRYARYDGSMTSAKREAALDTLRSDPKCQVLLCSLKCGALGLNLTCASRVVLVDPWWNPMISEQAIDRVHRLGQTRDVDVYEFIVMESVEERIMQLQDKKRELAKAVVEKGGKFVGGASNNKLTKDELFNIFRE